MLGGNAFSQNSSALSISVCPQCGTLNRFSTKEGGYPSGHGVFDALAVDRQQLIWQLICGKVANSGSFVTEARFTASNST